MKFWLPYTIENNLGDIEFEVKVEFLPGEAEVRYTSNGDGYPGSPATVEVLAIDLVAIEDGLDRITDISEWARDSILTD